MYTVPPEMQISCRIAHTPFKYPGSGGGSQCARWVGIQQHQAIPKPSKIKDFEKQLEGKEYY
jgi:hypothetical protein